MEQTRAQSVLHTGTESRGRSDSARAGRQVARGGADEEARGSTPKGLCADLLQPAEIVCSEIPFELIAAHPTRVASACCDRNGTAAGGVPLIESAPVTVAAAAAARQRIDPAVLAHIRRLQGRQDGSAGRCELTAAAQ